MMAEWDDFSNDELNSLFAQVGADRPCSSCGAMAWLIPDDKKIRDALLTNFVSGGPGDNTHPLAVPSGGTIPILLVICTNCGYVRSHSLGLLRIRAGKSSAKEPPK